MNGSMIRSQIGSKATVVFVICMAALLFLSLSGKDARSADSEALTGVVSSKEEGQMEGVLVTARSEGAKVAVTVVSQSQGRYSFPAGRLQPGSYRLKIRAAGYDLNDPGMVTVEANKTATRDLTLAKTKNLASQLTAAEWLMSAPGTPDQQMFGGFCIQCHSLEHIFRSKHDAKEWMTVMKRMVNYTATSYFEPQDRVIKPVFYPKQRDLGLEDTVGGAIPIPAGKLAEYLSTINLSTSKDGKWPFELKTLPRPKGRETKVIITEWDLPRREDQPHDAVVDKEGMVWYNDITGPYMGRLNPQTGEIKEWKTPAIRPEVPQGSRDINIDRDGNIWLGMRHQGGVARFDKKTETFTTWSLPAEDYIPNINIASANPAPDGTVWFRDGHKAYRLEPKSGEITTFKTVTEGYGMDVDTSGNLWLMDLNHHVIGEVDGKTGKSFSYPVPTPKSGPRRGEVDSQGRLWYGLYYAGKIGMFDTKTKQFKEWSVPPVPHSGSYYALMDDYGDVWGGSELTDNAYRLNPTTGEVISYLLPTLEANIQRIAVDSSKKPVTAWIAEAHQAKIARIEPLD